MRRTPVSFVGPVQKEGQNHYFLLLQGSGAPLKLEYGSRHDACMARATLVLNGTAHDVRKVSLLQAIQWALLDASSAVAPVIPE